MPKYSKEELENQLKNYEKRRKDEYKYLCSNLIKTCELYNSSSDILINGYIYIDFHGYRLSIMRDKIIEIIKREYKNNFYTFEGIIANIGTGIKLRPHLKKIYHNWDNLEDYPRLNKFKSDLKEIKEDICFKVKEIISGKRERKEFLYIYIK